MSIAAGPIGRNVEGTGSVSTKGKVSAMYSYSRTKGLFGGELDLADESLGCILNSSLDL
jgi:lipid-binding SYLF domain-containing protein